MSKQIETKLNYSLFIFKTAACFFSLSMLFAILAPRAFMQSEEAVPVTVITNSNMRMTGNNYQPTPEPPTSTIRGRVIYADTGRPARRAGLMLLPAAKGMSGSREKTGVTNERGEFEIKDVVAGRYFVSVSMPGVVTPFSSIGNFGVGALDQDSAALADIAKDFQEVVVNGVNDADVTVVVKRGAAITGRIIYADGEAAIGVRVEVLRKKDGQYNAVITGITEIFGAMLGGAAGGMKTDDRGVFRIAGLPAGEYVVRAIENVTHTEKKNNRGDEEFMAMSGISPGSMVATFYPNTDDVKKAEVLKIALGQEQTEVNITIPERELHNLSGTIVNKTTREFIKNARISLRNDDRVNSMFGALSERGARYESDEQGRWNFKELPAGKYTLTVEPPYDYTTGDDKAAQKPKPPKLSKTQKEIVIEGKDVTDLIVELGYGASVSGTVSFDDGQAFSQRISVSAAEENGKFSESDFVGAPGYDDGSKPVAKKTENFKVEGIGNGKFFINASAAGSAGEESGEAERQFYVKSVLLNGKDVSRESLEAKDGEELKNVSIILSRDVGKVKGSVVKADKTPAAGAEILFVSTDKAKWANFNTSPFATANGGGEFETSGAPGEYFVVFIKDDDAEPDENKTVAERRREWLERETAGAQKVTIKAKETEKVTLLLPEK